MCQKEWEEKLRNRFSSNRFGPTDIIVAISFTKTFIRSAFAWSPTRPKGREHFQWSGDIKEMSKKRYCATQFKRHLYITRYITGYIWDIIATYTRVSLCGLIEICDSMCVSPSVHKKYFLCNMRRAPQANNSCILVQQRLMHIWSPRDHSLSTNTLLLDSSLPLPKPILFDALPTRSS